MIDYTKYIVDDSKVSASDCTVVSSDNVEFKLHLHMLEACPIITAMFGSTMVEGITKRAHLPETEKILTIIFTFLYTNTVVSNDEAHYCDLLIAADKYLITELFTAVTTNIINVLTTQNAIDTLMFAISFPKTELSNQVLVFISKNFTLIGESKEYLELDEDVKNKIYEACMVLKMLRKHAIGRPTFLH